MGGAELEAPAPGSHREKSLDGCLHHPAVTEDDDELAPVGGGCPRQHGRDPGDEAGPALGPGGEHRVRVDIPVGPAEALAELRPGEPVSLTGVQFAQVAVGHGRHPTEAGSNDGRRLESPGQNRGVDGGRPGQLTGADQAVAQGFGLGHTRRGQTPAAGGTTHHPGHVAPGLTVAHQDDPGGPVPGGGDGPDPRRRRPPGGIGPGGGHANSDTNCSSCRRLRHSKTSSQCTAYSPTTESPVSQ